MITIREANHDDVPALYDLYHHIGKKDDGYFEEALERTKIYLALESDALCGFCLLNWNPRYSFYKRLRIPEIQDINVVPAQRRKGVATSLIKHCEMFARDQKCDHVGISVGLTRDYGPAQILYAKLGYIPDGNGVTHDREAVMPQRKYALNEELALMLLKHLPAVI